MKMVTIQNKLVLEKLINNQIHYAHPTAVPNLIQPYNIMMEHYKWKHSPIFGCIIGRYCEFYGADTNDTVILTLEVPEEMVKLQIYYDWRDVIYFTEIPEEWGGDGLDAFIENTLDGVGTSNPKAVIQATIPYIKPEWLIKYKNYNEEFDRKTLWLWWIKYFTWRGGLIK